MRRCISSVPGFQPVLRHFGAHLVGLLKELKMIFRTQIEGAWAVIRLPKNVLDRLGAHATLGAEVVTIRRVEENLDSVDSYFLPENSGKYESIVYKITAWSAQAVSRIRIEVELHDLNGYIEMGPSLEGWNPSNEEPNSDEWIIEI